METTTMTPGGLNKTVAMIAGAVLLLVGILGFVPNMDPILGVFETSLVHNIVHLLSGAVLLGAAFIDAGRNARMALLVVGVIYALVTVLGFVAPDITESVLGGTTADPALNMADNILHLVLAIVFIAVPLMVRETTERPLTGAPRV